MKPRLDSAAKARWASSVLVDVAFLQEGPSGATLNGGGYTYFCLTTQIVQAGDGYQAFDGFVREVNLCDWDETLAEVNRVWCCDGDLNCVEVYNNPLPDGACNAPGSP